LAHDKTVKNIRINIAIKTNNTTGKPVQPETTHNSYTVSTTYQLKCQDCHKKYKRQTGKLLNEIYKNT
jgi:hypothetical protein